MKITDIILTVIAGLVALMVFVPNNSIPQNLAGNITPQFTESQVINSSSSFSTGGAVIITNASNTGIWFRITNTTAVNTWCGLKSTSTGLLASSQLLSPTSASSSYASSTGNNVWELWGYKGAVSCVADGGGANVSFSYTGK